MTLAAHPSVRMTFINGHMIEGSQMWRATDTLCKTADEAWQALQRDGECNLQLLGDNLPRLRELFAGWVMGGQR